ncbi:MAG: hypothetical protein JWM90_982 [Thermoleophilia bacterium]|nr:hypothetical protein [Thermoleophilia bacterium]
MTDILDPFDVARQELHAQPAPVTDAARARLDAAMAESSEQRARPRRTRRTRRVRVGAATVLAGAAAALLAVALQPSHTTYDSRKAERPALRLVTGAAGGAFAGLDLQTASAADVLHAAGDSVAAGVPAGDDTVWTFVRTDQDLGSAKLVTERWTSPDGERSFTISDHRIRDHEPVVGVRYEELRRAIFATVTWKGDASDPNSRRAAWHEYPDNSSSRLPELQLRDLLQTARSTKDVAQALQTITTEPGVSVDGGMLCVDDHGVCFGEGPMSILGGNRLTAAQGRESIFAGLLLRRLAWDVFPPRATRAIYEYLGSMEQIKTSPGERSGEVALSFVVADATPAIDIPLGALDQLTGRVVKFGRRSANLQARYSALGVATNAGRGGKLCGLHPEACREVRDFAATLVQDPDACIADSFLHGPTAKARCQPG